MPNWCSTAIKFVCKNDAAEKVFEKGFKNYLDAMADDSPETNRKYKDNNGFGKSWLGNFWPYFDAEYPGDTIPHRGWVQRNDEEINKFGFKTFTMCTETAWAPCLEMWVDIMKKRNLSEEDVDVGYDAVEEGCELYVNDGYYYDTEYFVQDGEFEDWLDNEEILMVWIKNSQYINSKDKNLSRKRVKEGASDWYSDNDYDNEYTLTWHRYAHEPFWK